MKLHNKLPESNRERDVFLHTNVETFSMSSDCEVVVASVGQMAANQLVCDGLFCLF